jgi:hypothetical protein
LGLETTSRWLKGLVSSKSQWKPLSIEEWSTRYESTLCGGEVSLLGGSLVYTVDLIHTPVPHPLELVNQDSKAGCPLLYEFIDLFLINMKAVTLPILPAIGVN